jgi:hypothetical protein
VDENGAIKLPKACPQCHALKPPNVAVCANCGFRPTLAARDNLVPNDGELEELPSHKKTAAAKQFPDKALYRT